MVGVYESFGRTYCLHNHGDGGTTLLRNVGTHLTGNNTAIRIKSEVLMRMKYILWSFGIWCRVLLYVVTNTWEESGASIIGASWRFHRNDGNHAVITLKATIWMSNFSEPYTTTCNRQVLQYLLYTRYWTIHGLCNNRTIMTQIPTQTQINRTSISPFSNTIGTE
jgi:hypothetical protein